MSISLEIQGFIVVIREGRDIFYGFSVYCNLPYLQLPLTVLPLDSHIHLLTPPHWLIVGCRGGGGYLS